MDLSGWPGRREVLRAGVGLMASGLVMPKVLLPKFVLHDPAEEQDEAIARRDQIRKLCEATSGGSSALTEDFLELDEPDQIIRTAGASDAELPSQVQHFAWLNRVDYFAQHPWRVSEATRIRLGVGPTTWLKTAVWFEPLLTSFFGDLTAADIGDPGFVLVLPWYITTRHSFSLRAYEVVDGTIQLLESEEWLSQLKFDTSRPCGSALALNLQGLKMRPPPGREAGDVALTVRRRERVYRDIHGRVTGSDWVLQYGMAGPNDKAALERGEYYPNSADVRRPGYTKVAVVVLGRIPRPTRDGRVIPLAHQVSLSFDISGQVLNDINTLVREADRFISQYPGLSARLAQRLGKY